MRTYDDLCAAVASCGLEYARLTFAPTDPDDLPSLPYVVLVPQRTNNFFANDRIACAITAYDVNLYTDGSNMELEEQVGEALVAAGFGYQRNALPFGDGIVETCWNDLDCFDEPPPDATATDTDTTDQAEPTIPTEGE